MSPFHRNFVYQALTAGLQALLFSSLVFVDIYLTGQLGDVEVAAVGIAGRSLWVVGMVLYGIGSGAGVFFAQSFGRDYADGFRNVFKTSLFINLAVAVPAALVFFFLPRQILSYVANDIEVINLAVQYLRVVSGVLIFGALFMAIDYLYRATNHPQIPLYAAVAEIVLNIVLSFILVFGWYGAPKLGVVGAAWGSLIARLVRTIVLLYCLRHESYVQVYQISWLVLPKKAQVSKYLQKALPLMFNAAIWAVGVYLYSYVFAQISVEALAAWNALIPLHGLTLALLGGIATAAGMTVGQSLGAENIDDAWSRAKFSLLCSATLGSIIAVLLFVFRGFYASSFGGITESTADIITRSVTILTIMLPLNSMNVVLLVGIFRSGGVTTFNLVVDVLTTWVVALPLAYYCAFYLQWDVVWIMAIIFGAESLKTAICLVFFASKKWIKQTHI